MGLDEGAIREALSIRAAEADPTSVAAQLRDVTAQRQDRLFGASLRRLRSPLGALATTFATIAVAIAIAAFALRGPSIGSAQPPVGRFQAEHPVGLGRIGAETCVMVELDDQAYQTGTVSVWWWLVGEKGCRTSVSGPMATSAELAAVNARGPAGVASRVVYRVSFVLQLLPSGTEEVVFTLDPGQGSPGPDRLAAFRGADVLASNLTFDRVDTLDVVEPGGPNIPTPSTQ
jgi:hypothetical protein